MTLILTSLAVALLPALPAPAAPPAPAPPAAVTLGVDVLLTDQIALVAGKRVGLITNASGVDGQLVATADRLADDPRVTLTQLYAPEHGLRGALKAGERIADSVDTRTGVPVQGLFGKRKRPTPRSLKRVDVLLFDIQDIGSRTYTYVSTLGEAMMAAAAAGLPIIVLDRPNPLGGLTFEGPIREAKRKSFIGWGPLPVTHGMTVGELARFYNAVMGIGADLHVVQMSGWRRSMTWRATGLHWVPTSPGIPHAHSAPLYAATGMVGGVSKNVNEGVGTTQPFELIGADFIDAQALSDALNAAKLDGVRFRPVTYRPYYFRFARKVLDGVHLIVTNPARFRPIRTALTILTALETLHPGEHVFRSAGSVARVWGTKRVQRAVQAGDDVASIEASWANSLAAFAEQRKAALLYP